MHNLELTDDQTLILDTVRKFVQDSVAPTVLELDEHRRFAGDALSGLAELGLFGLSVAEAAGGAGMGLVPLAAALEEISGQNGSLARLLLGQVQCALALESGSPALGGVLSGEQLAAFVGPEHGIVATAGKLSGKAELVTGAGEAVVLVVAASQDGKPALFVVLAAATRRTPVRSLGFASAAPARVEFAGTAATVVATGADAERAIHKAQVAAWIGGGALAVGLGATSCVGTRKYASERIAFGKPLLVQQAVARKLVEGRRAVDAARHLVYHAARLADGGGNATEVAMQARIAAVDAAIAAADDGIQIHGGYGYVVEYHVERHYRDANTLGVLDGGNDGLRDRLAALQYTA
ncbi:MAG TPA: acyl-CoA dehydrogenase family protein [Planctomycetota bacterium]|nr:acyl-CoA dehydrogenase family protein [Planctomycetota bacterium]